MLTINECPMKAGSRQNARNFYGTEMAEIGSKLQPAFAKSLFDRVDAHSRILMDMALLDKMRAALTAGQNPIPLGDLMGFHAISIEPGTAIIEMSAGPQHHNPMGTVHGGVCCTLADTAMGIAHVTLLEDGETSTALEIKINFIRPVWKDTLTARGRAVKHGRTVSMMECDVVDAKDRLVARASGTFMTLRGEQAQGR